MEIIWIIIAIVYVAIGFIIGLAMVAANVVMTDVDRKNASSSSNVLFWILLGIIAWPLFAVFACTVRLTNKQNK